VREELEAVNIRLIVREELNEAGVKDEPDMGSMNRVFSILGNPLFLDEIHKKFAGYAAETKMEARSGYHISHLNVVTDIRFAAWPEGLGVIPTVCGLNSECFIEEAAVLDSVLNAGPVFRMMELGAGYGRWAVLGAVAAKLIGKDADLICVEGEKTHFNWIKQHFIDNGLDPKQHKLIEAAVHSKSGEVTFQVFNEGHDNSPNNHYGQSIVENAKPELSIKVKAITLNSLLVGSDDIDLIDMDIQGSEFDVLAACDKALINGKVRRFYIGTHSKPIERLLRDFFNELGWHNIYDFECFSSYTTEIGTMNFNDGIQYWVNPVKVHRRY
jgi:FkbM family methyltransferase